MKKGPEEPKAFKVMFHPWSFEQEDGPLKKLTLIQFPDEFCLMIEMKYKAFTKLKDEVARQ